MNVNMADLLDEAMKRIDNYYETEILSTGYNELDWFIGGFEKGKLYVIAGRPMMGKTTFALNIIEKLAVRGNVAVSILCNEMSAVDTAKRMICRVAANLDYKELSGIVPPLTLSDEAVSRIKSSDIYIDDNCLLDISNIPAETELLIVDYLQLLYCDHENEKIESRAREIEYILLKLKQLARERNIPVVVMSQLCRNVEYREDHRPILSDLRDTGVIEECADVVMFLYRDDMYDEESEDKNTTEIIVAKNRVGKTGVVKLDNYAIGYHIDRRDVDTCNMYINIDNIDDSGNVKLTLDTESIEFSCENREDAETACDQLMKMINGHSMLMGIDYGDYMSVLCNKTICITDVFDDYTSAAEGALLVLPDSVKKILFLINGDISLLETNDFINKLCDAQEDFEEMEEDAIFCICYDDSVKRDQFCLTIWYEI